MNKEIELIPVNVWLAGRSYRLRIHPQEEEEVRKSVKLVNDKILELKRTYAGKDDQDFIAMCLLMYATDNSTSNLNIPVIQHELNQIIDKIDGALK